MLMMVMVMMMRVCYGASSDLSFGLMHLFILVMPFSYIFVLLSFILSSTFETGEENNGRKSSDGHGK